ncbi:MAG: carboxypeptidase M32 [Rhodospirillaceae bacterium]|nr:carboxypeptidase M32 [Rhodospirillaceae bacterium]
MIDGSDAYDALERRFRRLDILQQAVGILHWDQSVFMPLKGTSARGAQLAELKLIGHEIITNPEIERLLGEVDPTALDSWQQANVREMRRIWANANAVPADLVVAHSKACTACEAVWREARTNSDFASVLPTLEEVLRLTREIGEVKASFLELGLYDALLDRYAPGMRIDDITLVLNDYADFLPSFLDRVLERQNTEQPAIAPMGPFPRDRQRKLMRRLAETVGLDFQSARLDESLHPFSGGIPEDSRITTRYDEDDFADAMMAVLHETGHAMYERGRPAAWRGQPVGHSRGMVIHESQSLLVEMQVCRSQEFIGWAAPMLKASLSGEGPAWEAHNLYRRAIYVRPGFIRVDADEVTYPAHIIMRTRLEQAMLCGDLVLRDLPGAWNDTMQGLLGIAPPEDRLGCLQDIHWYDGAWGYFPSYTLGAMAAAQIFQTARTADSDILPSIAGGDFKPLMDWLRKNIHNLGCFYTADELVEHATGRPLDPSSFKAHLQTRYLG